MAADNCIRFEAGKGLKPLKTLAGFLTIQDVYAIISGMPMSEYETRRNQNHGRQEKYFNI